MDEQRLKDIEARLSAALERPWHTGSYNATSLFVAHAPADIRDLLARVRALEQALRPFAATVPDDRGIGLSYVQNEHLVQARRALGVE